MYHIKKKLKGFSAAHRLIKGYQGKCKNLHGHNYTVEVVIMSDTLNQFDFVIDFDDIKEHFDKWVQGNWDHSTLVSETDASLIAFLKENKQHHFILPGGKNTSCESLAEFLFHNFTKILNQLQTNQANNLRLLEVRVCESEAAMAGYSLWNTHT